MVWYAIEFGADTKERLQDVIINVTIGTDTQEKDGKETIEEKWNISWNYHAESKKKNNLSSTKYSWSQKNGKWAAKICDRILRKRKDAAL